MKKDSKCPVTRGEVDLSKYEKVDGTWRELGLAAPARRALVNANLLKIADLMKITKTDFLELHGMGPKAAEILEKEMKRKKISFKK
jgi:DNA-directed RNA polymerase alpha subunit